MSEPTRPSAELSEVVFSQPAVGITNFTIHALPSGLLRLSFVESASLDGLSNYHFRAAVLLDQDGARNLAELLSHFFPAKEESSV
jgi:hypothetical protein